MQNNQGKTNNTTNGKNQADQTQPDQSQAVKVLKPRIRISGDKTQYNNTKDLVKALNLNTVCQEASCPNISECWNKSHAAFMILGSICTRACAFCNVATGKPLTTDPHEPMNIAKAVAKMGLKHVVITSVDRDDLEDGGAQHFVNTINAIRLLSPNTTVEILTPDFLRKPAEAVQKVVEAKPDVFNHNIETVPSLYNKIRPGARYFNSLHLLKKVKEIDSSLFTKSGFMVGLGEEDAEIMQLMDDLRAAEVDFLTIGQYLQPTPKHAPVKRYVDDEKFEYYKKMAYVKGFLMVSSSALTRSSYHADEDFEQLKKNREKTQSQTKKPAKPTKATKQTKPAKPAKPAKPKK